MVPSFSAKTVVGTAVDRIGAVGPPLGYSTHRWGGLATSGCNCCRRDSHNEVVEGHIFQQHKLSSADSYSVLPHP